MNGLFLILSIIILVVVIVAALIWKNNYVQQIRAELTANREHDLYADHYYDEALLKTQSDEQPKFLSDSSINDKSDQNHDDLEDQNHDDLEDQNHDDLEDNHFTDVPLQKDGKGKPAKKKTELIIALYVVTQQKYESDFAGSDILKVLEDLGLKYGHMDIFHHYGIGDLKVQQPVYSIANLVEPGNFAPQNMSDFSTPGLAFFMRLPGPFGGRVGLELMLNHAKRVAEVLSGNLVDETYALVNENKILMLRDRIANFEQRSTNLSMLQRFT